MACQIPYDIIISQKDILCIVLKTAISKTVDIILFHLLIVKILVHKY